MKDIYHWITVIAMSLGIFLSYRMNIKTIYWTIIIYQIRAFVGFMQVNDICGHDQPDKVLIMTFMALATILLNHHMIFSLFSTWRNKISFVTYFGLILGM